MVQLRGVAEEFKNRNGYSNVEFVASGAFKQTFKLTNASGDIVALKLFDPDKFDSLRTHEEIAAMLKCDFPFIGKLYDCGWFEVTPSQKYFFTMEGFFDGGSLASKLKTGNLELAQIKHYACILVGALKYLMEVKLVHRDIKPDNIMFKLGEDNPYLIDFGLARNLSNTSLTPTWLPSGPGTPFYSAPEQLNNQKNLIDWRTDQFSLGIVLGISYTGRHPFQAQGENQAAVIETIAQRKACSKNFFQQMKDSGLDWIIKMIRPWPVQRFQSPDELIEKVQN